MRDIRDLFDELDEGYYKLIKTNDCAFNDNYIEYKNENLSAKE